MHPFGGIPMCPRCNKAVYAAEQVMGPGRKLYHKPCMACMTCNRRLDSLSLVEHDDEPYCKQCHTKNFGTRDLRQANLPYREGSTSPVRSSSVRSPSPTKLFSQRTGRLPLSPITSTITGNPRPIQTVQSDITGLRTNMTGESSRWTHRRGFSVPRPRLSPPPEDDVAASPTKGIPATAKSVDDLTAPKDGSASTSESLPSIQAHATSNGSGASPGKPRPLSLNALSPPLTPSYTGIRPLLRPNVTGTRYGIALDGGKPLSPLSPTATGGGWSPRGMPGTSTPLCAKCNKPVYFAEQVKASGKTFHKPCLRCSECNTSLDSSRLAEKDGQVICRSCYSKLHGPRAGGYAQMGKAGGS